MATTTSFWVAFGLCLLKLCLTETQFNVSCRYGGVFHVEKNGRYSLTRSEAVELCRALNSTLATLEQLKRAHELGFETCRYGFVVGSVVIPRINPYPLCAANNTGVYKLSANTSDRYDAYCYNATETRDKACEPIERLDTSFLTNQSEIVIDNADGSRYNADGTRHSGDSSTSGVEDESVGSGSPQDTTAMDTSIRRSSPSYYGSATPASQLPDHSSGGGEKDFPRIGSDDEVSPVSPDISLATADGGHYPATTRLHDRSNITTADVTSSGNASDDEDTSEEVTDPTVFPGWSRSVAKEEFAPSTTDVTSSGNGSDDEDTSEEVTDPTVFPDWGRSVAQEEFAPSTTVDSQHGALLEISTADGWNPAYADEEEQYPSSPGRALVPSESEHHQGATQQPLSHSAHPGWIRQEQKPASTTGSTEQPQFTLAGENHPEKKPSATALASSPGAKQNDSAPHLLVSPGWDKGEDYATQTALMDRITPSREEKEETEPPTKDGAQHGDSTQPLLPSDNQAGQGTEGFLHPTDLPGHEVLQRTTAGLNRAAAAASPQTGTITEPMDEEENWEEATRETLAPGTPLGRARDQANTTEGSLLINWIPGAFPDTEDHPTQLQTPLPTSSTPNLYDHQGPHKGHQESTTSPGEPTTSTTTDSQPRSAAVPEWLIVVAALLALLLILAVCLAINGRRRCGQKKKLVINNGKGPVEERKASGLNGDASKSQEMVHLVHKEQSSDPTGACDEFLTVNETQNHQELDMRSGV